MCICVCVCVWLYWCVWSSTITLLLVLSNNRQAKSELFCYKMKRNQGTVCGKTLLVHSLVEAYADLLAVKSKDLKM